MVIVNNLSNAIHKRGLTKAEFARRLGVAPPAVSRLCRQTSFTFERLEQICEVLNVTDIGEIIRVIEEK